jgi:HK97 family phage portal protein
MLGRLLAPRDISNAVQATAWGDWGDSGTTYSGATVTLKTATQLLTVYGCNSFICDGIATLPLDVFRATPDGPVPVTAPRWIEKPTADFDRVAWTTQILTSLLLAGNAYVVVVRSNGAIVELVPLDPSVVAVFRKQGRKWYRVNGVEVDPFHILHIPGVMWPGSDVGLSPLEAARQTIGTGMSAQEFGARFFGQGAVMSGVIETPQKMVPDEAKAMARAWGRHHSGTSKAHLPGVLDGGATWKPTSITNEQAQFLETRKFTASEIAGQLFHIDPAELGLPVEGGSLTYTNQEERNIRKVQVTFLPWIVRIERALSGLLAEPRYVKFNVNGLLRGDMKSRFEAYAIGVKNQFMVPNESRAFEDWQPLPGGDVVVEQPTPTAPAGGPPNA